MTSKTNTDRMQQQKNTTTIDKGQKNELFS
jgi:hypothetical protein